MIKILQRLFSAILFRAEDISAGTWKMHNGKWPAFVQRANTDNPSIYIPAQNTVQTFPLQVNVQSSQDIFPVGCVVWSAADTMPGYLKCSGDAISRNTYSDLFSVIGTTYGAGDGATTFNLPNMNDRHVIGCTNDSQVGNVLNATMGRTTRIEEGHIPNHTHGYDGILDAKSHNHGGSTAVYDPGYVNATNSFSCYNSSSYTNDSRDGGTDLLINWAGITPTGPDNHGNGHIGGAAGIHTHDINLVIGQAHAKGAGSKTPYLVTPDPVSVAFPYMLMNMFIRY